jgi:hypothetical protein
VSVQDLVVDFSTHTNNKEAMKTKDKEKWDEAVTKEHSRMTDHTVFEAMDKSTLPKDAKVISYRQLGQ